MTINTHFPDPGTSISLSLATIGLAVLLYRWIPARKSQGPDSLHGPPSDSWLWGNLRRIEHPTETSTDAWIAAYGSTFSVAGFRGKRRVYTTDHTLINHILNRPTDFAKPWQSRVGLTVVIGAGLITREGDDHRRQVSVMRCTDVNVA